MLQAISHSKSGINFKSNKGINQKFKPSEDSLTSSVFSLLIYLPVELQWKIIRESIHSRSTPKLSGNIINYEFWPRWKKEEKGNKIEPDLFIEYQNFDLIIEAKRYDSDQQTPKQWQDQVNAYHFENREVKSRKPLILMAIGTDNTNSDIVKVTDKNIEVQVIKCRWSSLLQSVLTNLEIIKKSKGSLNFIDSTIYILEDLLLAYRIHGYSTGLWMNDIDLNKYRINISGSKLLIRGKNNDN